MYCVFISRKWFLFLQKKPKKSPFMYCIICYCTTLRMGTSFLPATSWLCTPAVHNGKFCVQIEDNLLNSVMLKRWCPHHRILSSSVFGYPCLFCSIHIWHLWFYMLFLMYTWLQLAGLSNRRPPERLDLLYIRDTKEVGIEQSKTDWELWNVSGR